MGAAAADTTSDVIARTISLDKRNEKIDTRLLNELQALKSSIQSSSTQSSNALSIFRNSHSNRSEENRSEKTSFEPKMEQ